MAPHQQTNHDRLHADPALTTLRATHFSPKTAASEDEVIAELDEPPDGPIKFCKKSASEKATRLSDSGSVASAQYRKASLLTQALLTSPDLTPISDADAPHLTSDGGLTSPARTTTPSPPLPATNYAGLPSLGSKELLVPGSEHTSGRTTMPGTVGLDRTQEIKVEETLGRKRCISFACGKKAPSQDKRAQAAEGQGPSKESASSNQKASKRPSMLKFACQMKPSRTESRENMKPQKSPGSSKETESLKASQSIHETVLSRPQPWKDVVILEEGCNTYVGRALSEAEAPQPLKWFNRIDFQKSEATSFHEFAGSYHTEDEWTNEQTAYRKKMTIMDTLQKENAIRQLAEEAEDEALEEDADLDNDGQYDDDDDGGENDDFGNKDEMTDGGNESDDEEGFAESEDESEAGYHFWTPGLTTAATSTDHVEHIRATQQRVASESSIESIVKSRGPSSRAPTIQDENKQRPLRRTTASKQPNAPIKPDEFIIGTLDEDRPLEEAYLSSLEHRKRAKHRFVPQDIDPSFPTSDPEAEDEGNESEDEGYLENDAEQSKAVKSIAGRWESSEDERVRSQRNDYKEREKTPIPSPKQLHSPHPRRLFGQSTHRLRSPPPHHKKLASPPSSRQPSFTGSPATEHRGVNIPHLAQRPNLTHTTSLPRTPNPFWNLQPKGKVREPGSPSANTSPKTDGLVVADFHSRGPVDIVQGLENRRQRRKEKFWRIHCQKAHTGKGKDHKCQPGKGAERMREVGKEMQDRFKGYGHRANLMLSI